MVATRNDTHSSTFFRFLKRPQTESIPWARRFRGQDLKRCLRSSAVHKEAHHPAAQKRPRLEDARTEWAEAIDALCTRDSQFFAWQYKGTTFQVHYTASGPIGQPVVLLHGFGVGGYHFEKNVIALAAAGHRVYAVDLVGQGASWPQAAPSARDAELNYSLLTWSEQLAAFVRGVVMAECGDGRQNSAPYLIGNSLGGLVAATVAYKHPTLAAGVVLLNAAPFWTVHVPSSDAALARLGFVPPPAWLTDITDRAWFSRLASPSQVRSLLSRVYADPAAIDETLVRRICSSASHPHAREAFVSIFLSPRGADELAAMIAAVAAEGTPVCALHGREDPWVRPLWARRLKRRVPALTYFDISPAGHCPHHEAPCAVNKVLCEWMDSQTSGAALPYQVGEAVTIPEEGGREVRVTLADGYRNRNVFELLVLGCTKLLSRLRGPSHADQGVSS